MRSAPRLAQPDSEGEQAVVDSQRGTISRYEAGFLSSIRTGQIIAAQSAG